MVRRIIDILKLPGRQMERVNEAIKRKLPWEKSAETPRLAEQYHDLNWKNFERAKLSGLNLARRDFSGCNLSDVKLVRANLEGASFRDADLGGTNLNFARMRGVDMSDADAFEAQLRSTDLTGAHLVRTDFTGARLDRSLLINANLQNAHLYDASMRYADLRGADLTGADTRGLDLEGAIFDEHTKITRRQLLEAKNADKALGIPWEKLKDEGTKITYRQLLEAKNADKALGIPWEKLKNEHLRSLREVAEERLILPPTSFQVGWKKLIGQIDAKLDAARWLEHHGSVAEAYGSLIKVWSFLEPAVNYYSTDGFKVPEQFIPELSRRLDLVTKMMDRMKKVYNPRQ